MWVRIKLNYNVLEKSQNRNLNFRTRTHLKLGQSTKISNNGKFGKVVRNNEREKNKNGEKVDRKSKNGRRKRIEQLDRVEGFLVTMQRL